VRHDFKGMEMARCLYCKNKIPVSVFEEKEFSCPSCGKPLRSNARLVGVMTAVFAAFITDIVLSLDVTASGYLIRLAIFGAAYLFIYRPLVKTRSIPDSVSDESTESKGPV
jgi:predicted RNA-binding Zn-ribbon protein involved in translation (DUF1610 family)